ncbi:MULTISPECIES: alpha/beta fold hydrolase [unclassified Caballeronia]|uniref:alpha/beta fold hydrolase n=1 Tax=unclassified Caballeronia TaxID=2646786 RepID=UPI001F3B63F6|nr:MULTISPECIES: alpha/beta hydrolase [unclassified Caballeronia]MCE4548104.1 alpha/beta hydrolase [Caballeronia sp. PC1]MCE4575758.1 alpha/beta hydrolase [Caballeronia sp. CLC5]
MRLENAVPEIAGESTSLVVAVHGWTASSTKMQDVRSAVRDAMPNADLLFPDYPAGLFSSADPIEITEALVRCIGDAVKARETRGARYEAIVLIGHSLGALLVRKAYVFARGENQDHSGYLRLAPQAWGASVSRIILLAGTNRGWELRQKARDLSWPKWLAFNTCSQLWHWLRLARLINSVREGAPFVANLRIQWISLLRNRSLSPPVPMTVQLLGTVDDIVDERDNVDIQCGASFVYRSVPETGHANVIDFSGAAGAVRKQIFLDALLTDAAQIESDMLVDFSSEPDVAHVVFVMHGIRDYGNWTQRLAPVIYETAKRMSANVRVVSSGYGYFPIARFMLQPERQKNVRWFMDQYTEALAKYPQAAMSFVGHSNGTYLLASALARYPACAFERAVFAGSVVNRNFPWSKHIGENRLTAIQNFVASADLVVAIFPAIFERLRKSKSDLGSAGHTGFAERDPPVYEVTYMRGGHGAAVVPENFETISRFVLGDEAAAPTQPLLIQGQASPAVWAGKFCMVFAFAVIAFALMPMWAVPLSSHFALVDWRFTWSSLTAFTAGWLLVVYLICLWI